MLTLLKDQTVYLDEVEYRVIRGSADQDTLLENKKTGERETIKTYTLVTKYLTGEFKTASQYKASLRNSISRKPARMDNMSSASKKETHRRIDFLVRLEKEGALGGGRARLDAALTNVAEARGDAGAPHVTTIYRWKKSTAKPSRMCAHSLRDLITEVARVGRGCARRSRR